jgi:Fe-Mn family superoxide dismutase
MQSKTNQRQLRRREFLALSATAVAATAFSTEKSREDSEMERYQARDYTHLIGMDGFSKDLLTNHFSLYQGYVANTNKALEILSALSGGSGAATYEYGEVKRRLGWEWNGMRLHELYFDNLGGNGDISPESALARLIQRQFGSYQDWERDFKATGSMRGIGWAILYHDPVADRLLNMWINEHDVAHPAGCTPILVMDVFEHAFMLDYGLKKGEYIDAFFRNVHWEHPAKRLERSSTGNG